MPYEETGGLLEDLQPRAFEQLYREMRLKTCAVDTHRTTALATSKASAAW